MGSIIAQGNHCANASSSFPNQTTYLAGLEFE